LQKKIEQSAFNIANGKVPITTVGRLVYGKEFKIGRVSPTVKPDLIDADLNLIFPDFVIDSLKEGIKQFGKKIQGFDNEEAIITAPESRSSSPIRIVRNEDYQSVNMQ
jgi:uncharacterized FAD-dependent dehydrogenase